MTEKQNTVLGPVFEAGPGWGERLGRWIKENWTIKLFPTIAVIILLAGIAKVYSQPSEKKLARKEEVFAPDSPAEVYATINKGDGIITISRRALTEYLKAFPDIQLKPEERLHIENFFQTKFRGTALTVGQEIKFLKADLEQAVNEALKLTDGQRQKLRAYIK